MRGICLLLTALAVSSLACGDSSSTDSSTGGGDDGRGGGGRGGANDGGQGGSTNSSGGNGGGNACQGVLGDSDPCPSCVEDNCCRELDACLDDPNCNECLHYEGDYCEPHPEYDALEECAASLCVAECTLPDECNPVTNEGCNGGDACDVGTAFTCFPGPNDAELCEGCDPANGVRCVAGTTCIPQSSQCGRFCCADTDCGTGVCSFDIFTTVSNIGICVGGATPFTPSCDAPAVSPSGGTCGDF